MTVKIKKLDAESASQLAELAKVIWSEHYTPIIGKAQVDYMVENFQSENAIAQQINSGMEYIGAYIDDELVGYSGIKNEEEKLFLSKLYLRKDMRGKGVGKALFKAVQKRAAETGKKRIYLTVNKHNDDSISIYKHIGFVIIDSVVSDIGNGFVMDDYIMEIEV